MNLWICPVKPKSWRITKKLGIFGAPNRAQKIMKQIKPDDLVIFHVVKPVNGIVAIGKVVSEVYRDGSDIYEGKNYPLRIKIDFDSTLKIREHNPIPLNTIFGNISEEFSIEPYLNIVLAPITKGQYENIRKVWKTD